MYGESNKIMLNDLLKIDRDSEDFKNGKITFNTRYGDKRHLDEWLELSGKSDSERCSFAL